MIHVDIFAKRDTITSVEIWLGDKLCLAKEKTLTEALEKAMLELCHANEECLNLHYEAVGKEKSRRKRK